MGRTVRPLVPLSLPAKCSVADIHGLIEQVPRNMCVGSAVCTQHAHLMDCCASSLQSEPVSPFYTDCFVEVLGDDCESSAFLATECRLTMLAAPKGVQELQARLSEWPLFRQFTPKCFALLSQFCNRGVKMLEDGELEIVTGVGLATGAAASQVQTGKAQYNGHCFNIGCVKSSAPVDVAPHCFLLEGTASMKQIRDTEDSPVVTVHMYHLPGQPVGEEITQMRMPAYLTLLCRSVASLVQIINSPNGGQLHGGGWPVQGPGLTGWIGSQMTMNSLDSTTYLEFYNRVMYMGSVCPAELSGGCMPVQGGVCQAGVSTDPAAPSSGLFTGCHPYGLNDCMLRGIGAALASDKSALMEAIMDEATPPMVDHSVFARLSGYWGQCTPLCDMNVKSCMMREAGVEYVRVSCTETPGIPELIPLMCRAKSLAFKLANDINAKHPHTDGVIFNWDEQEMKYGTGCHCFMDVPQRHMTSTAVNSLRKALFQLGWPGYVPMGDGC